MKSGNEILQTIHKNWSKSISSQKTALSVDEKTQLHDIVSDERFDMVRFACNPSILKDMQRDVRNLLGNM